MWWRCLARMTDAQRSALKSASPLPTTRDSESAAATVRPGRDTPHTRASTSKGTAAMRIAVGSDHAGFHLKEHVKAVLAALGHDVIDVGPVTSGSVDYPQFAADAARLVGGREADRGVLACGSGAVVAIVANKVAGVRAVNAHDPTEAEMARRHNDAKVVAISGSLLEPS